MSFTALTYDGEKRFDGASTYAIAEQSGVLTITDGDGVVTTYSPRGWYRVTVTG